MRAQRTLKILSENIEEISTVNEWAAKSGVSTRWLCKTMKQKYGYSPKKILRKVRYQAIIDCIDKDPDMTGYGIAVESGLKNEQALYKFLTTHYNTGLKGLRNEIWMKKFDDETGYELPDSVLE